MPPYVDLCARRHDVCRPNIHRSVVTRVRGRDPEYNATQRLSHLVIRVDATLKKPLVIRGL